MPSYYKMKSEAFNLFGELDKKGVPRPQIRKVLLSRFGFSGKVVDQIEKILDGE